MLMGDAESCSSRAVDFSPSQCRKQRQKVEVYEEVLCRLKETNEQETRQPGFEDELWTHFYRLPKRYSNLALHDFFFPFCFSAKWEKIKIHFPWLSRYALDVNVERAEDVLMHKRLLDMAHDPATRPAIEVRLVQVFVCSIS